MSVEIVKPLSLHPLHHLSVLVEPRKFLLWSRSSNRAVTHQPVSQSTSTAWNNDTNLEPREVCCSTQQVLGLCMEPEENTSRCKTCSPLMAQIVWRHYLTLLIHEPLHPLHVKHSSCHHLLRWAEATRAAQKAMRPGLKNSVEEVIVLRSTNSHKSSSGKTKEDSQRTVKGPPAVCFTLHY